MDLLLWILFGGIVGWLASVVMRTNSQQGIVTDIILGILGAVVGGFVANMLGGSGVTGFNLSSFVVALLGAMALIWVGKRFV